MKKISICLFSLLLFISSLTTVYAENDPIFLSIKGHDDSYHIENTSGTTLEQFIPTDDSITFNIDGDNHLKITNGGTTLELVPVGDGVVTFKQWWYKKPSTISDVEVAIFDGDTISIAETGIKSILAEFNPAPNQVIFEPNVNTITYTSTPTSLTSLSPMTEVTININYDPTTTQLDFIEYEGINPAAVERPSPNQVKFTMPPEGNAITVKVYGGSIINNVNISFPLPTEGEYEITFPATNSAAYDIAEVTIADVTDPATPVQVDSSNPIITGHQYAALMAVRANSGYSYKYTGTSNYTESETHNAYKYEVPVTINGATIASYLDDSDLATRNGYFGGISSHHNQLTLCYLFTAPEAPTPTNPVTPSGGGSSASYDHPIPNTGVK